MSFRRFFSVIVLVSIFVLGISNYVCGQMASGWYGPEEFDKAVEMAKKTNRPRSPFSIEAKTLPAPNTIISAKNGKRPGNLRNLLELSSILKVASLTDLGH